VLLLTHGQTDTLTFHHSLG